MSAVNEMYQMSSINMTTDPSVNMTDALTEDSSQEPSVFDETELIGSPNTDIVAAQLATAGPIGVAAAAAISTTSRKRRRLHSFETNPSVRKRQQTRLQRKLNALMEEYIARVGQQAAVIYCTPGKSQHQPNYYKVVGSQPLQSVIRTHKVTIMSELELQLAQQVPAPAEDTSMLFELPPLTVDGIPTQLDKMTQAQLRNFIPEMLRFSTGKSKPGWGKPECRPRWWPPDVPWANVRSDIRDDEEKKLFPWTQALRTIVLNCYRHHGREDLLPNFPSEPIKPTLFQLNTGVGRTLIQAISNPDGTTSYVAIETGDLGAGGDAHAEMVTLADGTSARVLHAIASSDGSRGVSFLQGSQAAAINSLVTEDGQLLLAGNGSALNMYSLYQPVLTENPTSVSSSSTSGVGYQVLAAASDGQLTLAEITPKLEKSCSGSDGICDDDDDDVGRVTAAAEFCEVQASELPEGTLDLIVECNTAAT